jgi:hypothetical protein
MRARHRQLGRRRRRRRRRRPRCHSRPSLTARLLCHPQVWVHYADWVITTPMLLLDLGMLAGMGKPEVFLLYFFGARGRTTTRSRSRARARVRSA